VLAFAGNAVAVLSYLKLLYYLWGPRVIFVNRGSRGLGDSLLLSVVLPELKRAKPTHRIVVETPYPELFRHDPHVDWATDKHLKTTKRHLRPRYVLNAETTVSIYEQLTAYVGPPTRTPPRLYLSPAETDAARRRFPPGYLVICPVGKATFSANRKEWGFGNFQALKNLLPGHRFVQIGGIEDPLLDGVADARGLAVRESAAVLGNARLFIGLEGGLMHLAEAVGTPAAIIYGGAIRPELTAYEDHLVFANPVECSPCFHSDRPHEPCETMICMKGITPESVAARLRRERGCAW
jgi:ADP-heptose:LPS heptosyltransferase